MGPRFCDGKQVQKISGGSKIWKQVRQLRFEHMKSNQLQTLPYWAYESNNSPIGHMKVINGRRYQKQVMYKRDGSVIYETVGFGTNRRHVPRTWYQPVFDLPASRVRSLPTVLDSNISSDSNPIAVINGKVVYDKGINVLSADKVVYDKGRNV